MSLGSAATRTSGAACLPRIVWIGGCSWLDLPGGVLGIEQQEVVPGLGQRRLTSMFGVTGSPDESGLHLT